MRPFLTAALLAAAHIVAVPPAGAAELTFATTSDPTTLDPNAGNSAPVNANGTSPYRITGRQPGLRTTLEAFDGWWGDDIGNVTEATYQPVQNSATAVAALLSGELDLIEPVPV